MVVFPWMTVFWSYLENPKYNSWIIRLSCAQSINLALVVALDSTNASNLTYIPTTHRQRRWMIPYWVLTPIASKHNGNYELENINKLIIARLQWTKQANRVNEPNSNELKHSSVKLNPTPVMGTKSHHPSLLSNWVLWFVNLSIAFKLAMLVLYVDLRTSLVICEYVYWFWNVMACLYILLQSDPETMFEYWLLTFLLMVAYFFFL